MLPDHYHGIWRRAWIQRNPAGFRDNSPAIWFQSAHHHVDIRINPALQSLTNSKTELPHSQIAFAGKTTLQSVDGRELCQWHPAFAYPEISDEIDCGYMEFQSSTQLIESGIDNSYVESWHRINGNSSVRCLRFEAVTDKSKQCYIIFSGDFFALGSNVHFDECAALPGFAWGVRQEGTKQYRVRESLAPWWAGRDIEIDSALFDEPSLPIDLRVWHLPLLATRDWYLRAID